MSDVNKNTRKKTSGAKISVAKRSAIRLYYETHDVKAEDVASHFKVSRRAIYNWIKDEGWERNKLKTEEIQAEIVNDAMLRTKNDQFMRLKRDEFNRKIAESMGSYSQLIENAMIEEILSPVTEQLLMRSMSLESIQKRMALTAQAAHDEFINMLKVRDPYNKNPDIIESAGKVMKLLSEMQNAIYGKEVNVKIHQENRFDEMSNEELLAIINEAKNDE